MKIHSFQPELSKKPDAQNFYLLNMLNVFEIWKIKKKFYPVWTFIWNMDPVE